MLNLAWLHEDRLWPALFGRVLAPPAVRAEFERLASVDHRFRGLRFPAFISIEAPGNLPQTLATNEDLDPGEAAVLALALKCGIRHVLIDELAGRRAALALGLQPSGLLGVLVEAKKRALLPAVLPLLDRLRDGARFHVGDDLRQRIAALAGEVP